MAELYEQLRREVESYNALLRRIFRYFHSAASQDVRAKQLDFEYIVELSSSPTKKSLEGLKYALEARRHQQALEMCQEMEEKEVQITALLYSVLDLMEN